MYSNSYENVRRMFWDGKVNTKDGKTKQYSLDEEGIKYSVRRALHDYTARTESKKEDESLASVEKMFNAIPQFIIELSTYFNMETPYAKVEDYDIWHHKMCELFKTEIINSKIRSTLTYGKAQKIVNMSMKTIYCLNGAEQKARAGFFKFCHMPLDSITINWFRIYVAESWFNDKKKQKERIKISLEGGPLPKWSSLTFDSPKLFDDYCNEINQYNKINPYDYMFFVTMIRKYFEQKEKNPYYNLTPFEAEFYIWPEMQYEMAAETLIKQDLLKKLQSNVGVSTNNVHIQALNTIIADTLGGFSEFY